MDEAKEPSLLTPLVVAVILLLMFGLVSSLDYAEALTADAIRKDPPKIIGYSIKQSSPGLDNGELMFPLYPPVASDDIRAVKASRRSTREQR